MYTGTAWMQGHPTAGMLDFQHERCFCQLLLKDNPNLGMSLADVFSTPVARATWLSILAGTVCHDGDWPLERSLELAVRKQRNCEPACPMIMRTVLR